MSIVAYTGLPGSGKSYSVVELQVIPALRAGRTVVTNIPLVADEIDKLGLPGRVEQFDTALIQAEPHKILEFCRAGVIFIIDEVWRLWPQGLKADEIPEVYKSVLAEHRHQVDENSFSTQIVLVTQDLGQIAMFARRLVEETFVTTKLSTVGFSRGYRVDVYHGGRTGHNVTKSRLRMITGVYRKEIYCLYKSHTKSEAAGLGANEGKMDTRANIFKRPAFIIGVAVVPALLWGALHLFNSNFHGLAMKQAVKPPERFAAPAARSGSEHSREPSPLLSAPSPGVSDVRVLFEVVDEAHPEQSRAYLATGGRVVELVGGDGCRYVSHHVQCLYRDAWYDDRGIVESAPAQPVGAYHSGPDVRPGPVASQRPSEGAPEVVSRWAGAADDRPIWVVSDGLR